MEHGRRDASLGRAGHARAFAGALVTTALLAGVLTACGSGDDVAAPATLVPPATVRNDGSTPTGSDPPPSSSATPSAAPVQQPPPATTPPLTDFTGDPFFDPGDATPGAPGEILRSRPIEVSMPDANAWQILYWSRTAEDRPVAVSATVVADARPATGARPVLAYAHPTAGLADECAPSAQIADGTGLELQLFPVVLQLGWVAVETDYQGLGTPGDHPYLVGQSEGRNVLDSIRAAQRLAGTGADPSSPALVWGHSQGGGAAAFTAELQPTYAPDVDLVGAIAGAPPAHLEATGFDNDNPSYDGFIPMAVAGFRAGYPELADDDDLMTATGRTALEAVSSTCVVEALADFRGEDTATLFAPGTFDRPAWRDALAANQAGERATDVPIFLYHGSKDDLIPAAVSEALLERYCALGVTAYRKVYDGRDHTSVIAAALGDIASYGSDRLAGRTPPSSCPAGES